MIEVPEAFARVIVGREGDPGLAWIARLPTLVDELLQEWDCRPVAPLMHGQVGIVLPVTSTQVPAGVLKVSFPHPGNVHEPDAFEAWRGEGAVLMHRRDDASFAMLLERAQPRALSEADDDAVAIAGRLVRRLAVAAPAGMVRLSDLAAEWEVDLFDDAKALDWPLPSKVIEAAAATYRELGPEQPDTLVHGDLPFGNILRADREPWLAIDPKGLVGDPAYDTIHVLAGSVDALIAADSLDAALRRRLDAFADAAEIDRERVQRWAHARIVSRAHRARHRRDPEWIIQLANHVATVLT